MNSLDKYMEDEWNQYIANNSGMSIRDMMVDKEEVSAIDKFKQMIINEEIECNGLCSDCTCGELEKEFISHPKEDEAKSRKDTPVFSGVLKYFPNALKEVSKCSKAGNDQHHPDKPLHWDMDKSKDEYDALTRHLIDHTINPMDTDGILHLTKVAWRALAGLERHLTNKL
jgi:hypothetical protein